MSDMDWIRGFVGALVLAVVIALERSVSRVAGFRAADRGRRRLGVDTREPQALFRRNRSRLDPARRRRPEGDRDLFVRRRQGRGRADRGVADHRRADPQSRRVRGQEQDHQGPARRRGAVEGRHGLQQGDRGGRHRPHQGGLQEIRPQRGPGHQAARRAAERTLRPRVHDRRRREDRHPRNPFRRQQHRLQLPSAEPDADEHDESAVVVQEHRRLRSGPSRLRRGGDPPLLYEERVRRLPHHQHGRHVSEHPARLHHHDHAGGGAAVPRLWRVGRFAYPAR